MRDEWRVGRVIARPYVGKKKGEFKRTSNRHDYALKPTGKTALNALKDAGYDVISVGKINDIFGPTKQPYISIKTSKKFKKANTGEAVYLQPKNKRRRMKQRQAY